jgi:hypothetical protein
LQVGFGHATCAAAGTAGIDLDPAGHYKHPDVEGRPTSETGGHIGSLSFKMLPVV